MKYVKMLGLAAVAAAALMAFVGASSASATVLCTVEPTEGSPATKGTVCPSGKAEIAGQEIHAVNKGTVTLDGEFFNIECSTSTIKGKTLGEGSATETVKGPIETLTFTSCGSSTVTVLKPGELEIHWIPDTFNGTLTGNGQEITTTSSTIFGSVHCIFTVTNQSLGDVTGGNPAIFKSNAKIKPLTTNSLCPNEGAWTAEYEITTPKPLYIAGHT